MILPLLTEKHFYELLKKNKEIMFIFAKKEPDLRNFKVYKDIIFKHENLTVYLVLEIPRFLKTLTENVYNSYIFFKQENLEEIGILS